MDEGLRVRMLHVNMCSCSVLCTSVRAHYSLVHMYMYMNMYTVHPSTCALYMYAFHPQMNTTLHVHALHVQPCGEKKTRKVVSPKMKMWRMKCRNTKNRKMKCRNMKRQKTKCQKMKRRRRIVDRRRVEIRRDVRLIISVKRLRDNRQNSKEDETTDEESKDEVWKEEEI